MRISFVLPAYYSTPIGGYRVVYEQANFLARAGHKVTIVFPRRFGEVTTIAERLKDALWPTCVRLYSSLRNRPLVSWMALHETVVCRLTGRFDEHSIPDGDVVFATAWQTAQPVAALSSEKGRKFYMVQDHEVWLEGTENAVNETFGLGMRIVAAAQWLSEIAIEHGGSDVHVVPNGLDQQRFRVVTDPATRDLSILALYHEDGRKAVGIALSALTKIHALFPAVRITMFGVPKRAARIPDWIRYVNLPTPEHLLSLYNEHAIFLSSSQLEGWCLPAAEAMACGCTFVGTDSLGPREFCQSEVSALLSPPGDVEALVTNLTRGITDPILRHRLQSEGTKTIQSFTWSRSGDELLKLIDSSGRVGQ